MSSIQLSCSSCSERLNLRPALAGKRIKCPKCQAVLEVPDAPGSEVEPKPARRSSRKQKPARTVDDSRDSRRGPPQRKKKKPRQPTTSKPRRKPSRQPVADGFEGDDDPWDDGYDEFGDFDDAVPSKKKSSVSKGVVWARRGVLVFAIAMAIRTAGFTCQLIAKLTDGFNSFGRSDLMITLLKANHWLHLAAIVVMLGAYVLFVMSPDRKGSQGWGIACLVMGVIALGLLFFLQILPIVDSEIGNRFVDGPLILRSSLGTSLMKRALLELTYIIHMGLGLMFLSSFSHSKNSIVRDQCQPALMFLGIHAALILFKNLYLLFVAKVVFPAAMESREPPSQIWQWIGEGVEWLALASFLVFLILAMKVLFGAKSVLK